MISYSMILLKGTLTTVLCVLVRGHENRELGFTGLDSKHADNHGASTVQYDTDRAVNVMDKQDNVPVPQYSAGFNDFASVPNTPILANTGHYSNHIPSFPINAHINPILTANLGSATHDIPFNYGSYNGIPFYTGSVKHGLPFTPTTFGLTAQKAIAVQPQLVAPLQHLSFPGLTTAGINDQHFHSNLAVFPAPSAPIQISNNPTFGHGLLKQNHGFVTTQTGHYHSGNTHFGNYQNRSPTMPPVFTGPAPTIPPFGHNFEQEYSHPTHVPYDHQYLATSSDADEGNNNRNALEFMPSAKEHQETSTSQSENVYHNDAYSNQASEGGFDTSDNNGSNQPSVESVYHDYYSNSEGGDHKGNSYKPNVPSEHQSSPEAAGDTVGSYVSEDVSQINQASSVDQKFGRTGGNSGEQGASNIHQLPTTNSQQAAAEPISSTLVTNGHAVGNGAGNNKATSFQSFVIHSYKPQTVFSENHSSKAFAGVFGHRAPHRH